MARAEQHKVIAIDLDDTLATTIQATIAYVSKKLNLEMRMGNIAAQEYWDQYGIVEKEAIALVHEFNLKSHPGLEPLPGAAETTRRLSENFDLYVVTARDHGLIAVTKAWVDLYFPGTFKEVIFSGNPWISKNVRPKHEICQEIGADWIIDDSVSTVLACANLGMNALLFGGHAWHGTIEKQPRVHFVKDWQTVKEYFDAQN